MKLDLYAPELSENLLDTTQKAWPIREKKNSSVGLHQN